MSPVSSLATGGKWKIHVVGLSCQMRGAAGAGDGAGARASQRRRDAGGAAGGGDGGCVGLEVA